MFDPAKYLFTEVYGKRVAYQRSGSGTPVLMLHGITSYSFLWRKVVDSIGGKYDLIRMDLLGCGASEMSVNFDLSLKSHASLVIGFMDSLNIKKCHLVGHDLGGGIAQILGVDKAERFITVSLLNPVGYDSWPVQPISSMRTPIFRQIAMAAFDRGYYKSIVRKAVYKRESFTEELIDLFWSNFQTPNSKKSFLQFAKCLDSAHLQEIEERLRTISIPVLILRAEFDVFLSSSITERLHQDIPGSKLEILPDSGHYMQEDSPDEIARLLSDFWKENMEI